MSTFYAEVYEHVRGSLYESTYIRWEYELSDKGILFDYIEMDMCEYFEGAEFISFEGDDLLFMNNDNDYLVVYDYC